MANKLHETTETRARHHLLRIIEEATRAMVELQEPHPEWDKIKSAGAYAISHGTAIHELLDDS